MDTQELTQIKIAIGDLTLRLYKDLFDYSTAGRQLVEERNALRAELKKLKGPLENLEALHRQRDELSKSVTLKQATINTLADDNANLRIQLGAAGIPVGVRPGATKRFCPSDRTDLPIPPTVAEPVADQGDGRPKAGEGYIPPDEAPRLGADSDSCCW